MQVSLARYLSGAGFDTWILEVRGAGLSKREGEPTSSELGGTSRTFTGAIQDAFVKATVKTATNRRATTEEKKQRSSLQGNVEAVEEKELMAVKKEDKPMAAQETTEIMTEVQKSADAQGITSVKKVNDESVLGQETKAMEKVDDSLQDEETMATRLTNSVLQLSQKLSGLVSEGQSQLLSARFIEKVSIRTESQLGKRDSCFLGASEAVCHLFWYCLSPLFEHCKKSEECRSLLFWRTVY